MRVRFWGTRGSIPKPGPGTIRYGGNTSCVEVRSAAGTLVILDCGTGLHNLGQALMATAGGRPLRGHVLISHTHWDHIQGIPFFAPFFVPGNRWDIYAPRGLAQPLRETLAGQMRDTYFPVTLEELGADIRYHDLVEGVFQVGDVGVRARYLHHTALTLGYRLEADGAALVYACDHEPYSARLATGAGDIRGQDRRHAEFLAGADLVIHDAQYTAAEYPAKARWGHSTVEYAVAVCRRSGARRLALTHHDPLRDDAALDRVVEHARAEFGADVSLDVFAAVEGEIVELAAGSDARPERVDDELAPAMRPLPPAVREQSVLVGTADPTTAGTIDEALRAGGIRVLHAPDAGALLGIFRAEQPSLVILDERLPGGGGLETCRAIRALRTAHAGEVPVVVMARHEDPAASAAGVTDWLVQPFSSVYVRTRARAWLLRARCRWQRAPVPEDEERRLAALRRIGILDTEPEERFDRLTRLAAALFDVPIALVSLVDRDRQWLKSHHGLDVSETPREVSFCAHAILDRDEVMVVPDSLLDPRFADNPVVAGEPRVRFYAGCPLILPGGSCAGTLCLVDTRPRELSKGEVQLLQDLGALVQQELSATTQPAPTP